MTPNPMNATFAMRALLSGKPRIVRLFGDFENVRQLAARAARLSAMTACTAAALV
jgi:hypothetical protein